MDSCAGILLSICLACFGFSLSLLDQNEKLDFYLFVDNLYSKLDEKYKGGIGGMIKKLRNEVSKLRIFFPVYYLKDRINKKQAYILSCYV
jgi:hypothetical protein